MDNCYRGRSLLDRFLLLQLGRLLSTQVGRNTRPENLKYGLGILHITIEPGTVRNSTFKQVGCGALALRFGVVWSVGFLVLRLWGFNEGSNRPQVQKLANARSGWIFGLTVGLFVGFWLWNMRPGPRDMTIRVVHVFSEAGDNNCCCI